jgi:F-box interacting protein
MLNCDDINDEYTKRRVIPTCGIEATYGGRKINFDRYNIHPIGTCNGLILLVCGDNDDDDGVAIPIIWNPCVRKFLVLPSPSASPYKHGFTIFDLRYDPHSNDYKILQLVVPRFGDHHMPCTFQVFSLLRGSWKSLNVPADFKPFISNPSSVEISGVLHWISGKHYHQINEDTVIVTFNMSSDIFGEMKIPQVLKTDLLGDYCVKSRYRESLALLFRKGSQIKDYYELWVMKEYGLAESWTKLSTIYIPHSLTKVSIYFRNSGQLVLGAHLYGVQSLDPKSKQVKNIVDDRFLLSFMDPFVERLVLLDRYDAFSY